jgi:hypothetical protein
MRRAILASEKSQLSFTFATLITRPVDANLLKRPSFMLRIFSMASSTSEADLARSKSGLHVAQKPWSEVAMPCEGKQRRMEPFLSARKLFAKVAPLANGAADAVRGAERRTNR